MTKFIIKIAVIALAVIGASYFVPGISVSNFWAAIIFALILALVNLLIKPLINLITTPLRWLTFGLSTLIINTLLFWLAAKLSAGVEVATVLAAFVGALLVSVVSSVVTRFLKKK